jgi:hypothetical protein
MTNHQQLLRRFFDRYAKRMNDALKPKPKIDTAGVVRSFADYFVEASPAGVFGGKNGLRFRLIVPRGFRHYRKIGTTAMLISGFKATRIDDLHYLVRVGWDSRYLTRDGARKRIQFTNIYLVQVRNRQPRIFAYITGDEQKVLREHGIT